MGGQRPFATKVDIIAGQKAIADLQPLAPRAKLATMLNNLQRHRPQQ